MTSSQVRSIVLLLLAMAGLVACAKAHASTQESSARPVLDDAAGRANGAGPVPGPAGSQIAREAPAPAADRAAIPELAIAEPIEFPADVLMIIETGCWACDGPTRALYRVGRDSDGPVEAREIIAADIDPRGKYITSFALTPSASDIIVGICTYGYCGGLSFPGDDAVATFYRSHDLGETWSKVDAPVGMVVVVAVTPEGVVFSRRYESYVYEDGRELTKPAPDAQVSWCATRSCGIVWWLPATREVILPGGRRLDFPDSEYGPQVTLSDAGPAVAVWLPESEKNSQPFSGFYVNANDDTILHAPDYLTVGGWLGDRLVGSYPVPRILHNDQGAFEYALPVPSLINVDTGALHPIVGVFDGEPFVGRNRVVAVLPFAVAHVWSRATTGYVEPEPPEACVVLRDRPVRNYPAAACERPSRLWQTGEQRFTYGQWYYGVFTPSGRHGWVEAQLLPATTR